jgi:hypothetical protein
MPYDLDTTLSEMGMFFEREKSKSRDWIIISKTR